MSTQKCSGTTGFPINVTQNLFSPWPGGFNPSDPKVTNQLVVATDFSVAWAPKTTLQVSVDDTLSQFQILGLDSTANANTNITYGMGSDIATYHCQPKLSLVKIQHANLIPNSPATQELVMTFKIKDSQNKKDNPSSPDIILLCRPVILAGDTKIGSEFWKAVNTAALNKSKVQTTYNAAENFTYSDGSTLLPMITYQTCIPTRLIGGPNAPKDGSIRMRVHVVTQPLSIPSSESGSGKCSAVPRFIMPVNGLVDIFGQAGYTKVQFTNGVEADGVTNKYPTPTTPISDSLTLSLPSSTQIVSWQSSSGIGSVLQTFQYLVPDTFLGKSLSEISGMTKIPDAPATKKAFKCYTIDPKKDVVDDQILIDPTTGRSLQDTMNQQALDASGGDPALAAALAGQAAQETGILPGDIEQVVLIIFSTIGGIALVAHLFYVIRLFMIKNYHDGQIQLMYFVIAFILVFVISLLISDAEQKKIAANAIPASKK